MEIPWTGTASVSRPESRWRARTLGGFYRGAAGALRAFASDIVSGKPAPARCNVRGVSKQATTGHNTFQDVDLTTSRPMRVVYAAAGFVALGLGIAGTFIPGLPGFLFLLFALFLFSRSNERMYRWMLTNRYFGQSLRDYKSGLGIPRVVKVIAVSSIAVAVTLSVVVVIDATWGRVALVALGFYGVWYVLTRPTREVEVARRAAALS